MNEIKLQSILGFASKAGKLAAGTAAVENLLKKQRVYLVICATDLAAKTVNNFQYRCRLNKVPFYCYGARDALGSWIGFPGRGVVGITSRQFATVISRLFIDRGELP
ncbi:MAG: ribosomal L7Ae/L30e/S12e/Gadd45 family protein [Bacillota bacterium]|jgi:ribosomal protein L7Ae-like RNA K-turn-binding protein